MKFLVGMEVFLRPINNEARFRDPSKTIKAIVEKVGRSNITITIEGRERKLKICPSGKPDLHDSFNGGFRVFDSEQAALDFDESLRLARILSDAFRYQSDWQKFSPSVLLEVARLLEVKTAKKDAV